MEQQQLFAHLNALERDFILASGNGTMETVERCLRNGVYINTQTSDGRTALFVASWYGRDGIVVLLLSQEEVDVNLPTNTGWTPLMIACRNGRLQAMNLLVEAGAKLDQQTKNTGSTALHLAISQSNIEAAELLMDHGADLFVQDNHGHTPLDVAPSDEIKRHLRMYNKMHQDRQKDRKELLETRKELTLVKNLLMVNSFGKDSSGNDQPGTLQGKVDKATRDIAQLQQENVQLHGTVGQLQQENAQLHGTVDQLQTTVDELQQHPRKRQKTD